MLTVTELSALIGEIGSSLTGVSPDRAVLLASGGDAAADGEAEDDDDAVAGEAALLRSEQLQRRRGIPATTRLQRMALGAWQQSYPAFSAALLAHAGADGGSAVVQVGTCWTQAGSHAGA